jgi:hypothetical protein
MGFLQRTFFISATLAASLVPLPASHAAPSVSATAKVDFFKDVQPIFKESCYGCHGPDQQMGGLRLDQKAAIMKGGASGKPFLPGNSKESLILHRVMGQGGPQMPLGFPPLSAEKIARIRLWIDQGADWPDSPAGSAKHWAYQAPVRPPLPKVQRSGWVKNPIDAFVLARLEKEGLQPSHEASKETLIRRATFDLTGLPPTPKEVDAFLADKTPHAYEKVVGRLLASPHYGERWARPWLDLARYADTNGYEKDERRSIWKYRDWVINAFNRDMPFDQFTIEQIAGDMLPNATLDQKIATGFHRNTMFNAEGGVDQEEQRWITLIDRVGTTGSVWLGSTIQCSQCHNHKYDPFTQKEFYQFLAFFDHSKEPQLSVPTPGQVIQQASMKAEIERLDALMKAKPGETPAYAQRVRYLKARAEKVQKELDGLPVTTTLAMEEIPDRETPSTYLRIKGAFLQKGEKVYANVPACLPPLSKDEPRNRLGLAKWLVDKRNPLTARVTVNRIWEQYFGQGIVETSEDFGSQGSPPTHPELLDWLATEFMNKGWSQKAIHRLIVTSATYKQSSSVTPALLERDPNNKLLARGPRFRLEAEMVRDLSLAASGLLSPKIGGPSVFPPQPEGVWNIPYNGDQWVTSTGEDRYRRAIYTFLRRTSPYPMLLNFDGTSHEFCTVRRIRTDTPLQALNTLNDEAFFEAARHLAKRMQREGGANLKSKLTYGFRLCLTRKPTPLELSRLTGLFEKEAARYHSDESDAKAVLAVKDASPDAAELAALTLVSNVLLNLDETLTKE